MKRLLLLLLIVGCATGQAVFTGDTVLPDLSLNNGTHNITSVLLESDDETVELNLTFGSTVYFVWLNITGNYEENDTVFNTFSSTFTDPTLINTTGMVSVVGEIGTIHTLNISGPTDQVIIDYEYSTNATNLSDLTTGQIVLDVSVGEICNNDGDDDADGDIDCADSDCVDSDYCELSEDTCSDDSDNDGDDAIDCADSDCDDLADCEYGTETMCEDGFDNDGDGDIDCADDDCMINEGTNSCEVDTETLCDDGLDNDGDTFVDCDDADCNDARECREYLEVETYVEPERIDYASLVTDRTDSSSDSSSDSSDSSESSDSSDSSDSEGPFLCLSEALSGSNSADIELEYDGDVVVRITPDDELPDYIVYFYGYDDDGDREEFAYESVDGHDDAEEIDFELDAEEDYVVELLFYTDHPANGGVELFTQVEDTFVDACE